MLLGESAPDAPTNTIHGVTEHDTVRAREIDVFEDAVLCGFGGGDGATRAQALRVDRDHLPRLDFSDELRAHQIQRARLARDHVTIAQPPQAQWAEAVRVAERDHAVIGEQDDRVGPLHLASSLGQRVLDDVAPGQRHEVQEHLGVERGLEDAARLLEPRTHLTCVGEVAIVRQRQRTTAVHDAQRLRVLERQPAGGRVAVVSDRAGARHILQLGIAIDVGHEADALDDVELAMVTRHHAGRLLATVLQSVQPERCDRGGLRHPDRGEHAALLVPAFELVPAAHERPPFRARGRALIHGHGGNAPCAVDASWKCGLLKSP